MHSPSIEMTTGGPAFSRVALGMWRLASWNMTPQQRLALVEHALELGITTIDHADIYGSYLGETLFGEALALAPHLRQRMQIVGKCGIKLVSPQRPAHAIKHYDTSRSHILASVDNSLEALRTDHLDLLLIHRPDPLMDADEVAEAFDALCRSGKVRHFGVSNFSPAQFELLAARVPLVTNQIELSALQMGPLIDGTLDLCQRLRIKPMIWSALAGGRLFSEDSPQAERVRDALKGIADERGVSPTVVAYAWVLRLPAQPVVLTGSQRVQALQDAVAATALELTREEWFRIWTASAGSSVP